MLANYHTHTYRCHHAEGSEKEYIEAAIRGGIKVLGFSDHTPYLFREPWQIRMMPEELPGYVETLRALAGRYAGQIELRIGVEAEYYPAHFASHVAFLRENGIRYLLLGQHFLGNEAGEPYCGRPTEDVCVLERYVEQSAEALHEPVIGPPAAHKMDEVGVGEVSEQPRLQGLLALRHIALQNAGVLRLAAAAGLADLVAKKMLA